MSRVFAYCRVSTFDQTPANQSLEILSAGFTVTPSRTVSETVSGSVAADERPAFKKLLERVEVGDVLVVTKLDRLGRNAMDVRATVERLTKMGVRVHCLALGGVDLSSPAGKMTMGVIASVAEFERDLLVERTQAGLSRAKAEGKALGRPYSLNHAKLKEAGRLLRAGTTVAHTARLLKTSRQTVMRVRTRMGAGIGDGVPLEAAARSAAPESGISILSANHANIGVHGSNQPANPKPASIEAFATRALPSGF